MTSPRKTLAFFLSLSALAAVALTGCSTVDAVLTKSATSSYDDTAALQASEAAPADVDWVPADADALDLRTSTIADAPDGVLTFTSETGLDPTRCAEVERRSAPAWGVDGAPDVYALTSVVTCGDWSAIETGSGGWLAWTPNSQLERADAEAALG